MMICCTFCSLQRDLKQRIEMDILIATPGILKRMITSGQNKKCLSFIPFELVFFAHWISFAVVVCTQFWPQVNEETLAIWSFFVNLGHSIYNVCTLKFSIYTINAIWVILTVWRFWKHWIEICLFNSAHFHLNYKP